MVKGIFREALSAPNPRIHMKTVRIDNANNLTKNHNQPWFLPGQNQNEIPEKEINK